MLFTKKHYAFIFRHFFYNFINDTNYNFKTTIKDGLWMYLCVLSGIENYWYGFKISLDFLSIIKASLGLLRRFGVP